MPVSTNAATHLGVLCLCRCVQRCVARLAVDGIHWTPSSNKSLCELGAPVEGSPMQCRASPAAHNVSLGPGFKQLQGSSLSTIIGGVGSQPQRGSAIHAHL